MITNPLLEEIWAIKERLDAESGGDIRVFCQQLRDWSAKNLPERTAIYDPKDLRAVLAKQETQEALALREQPPKYGSTGTNSNFQNPNSK